MLNEVEAIAPSGASISFSFNNPSNGYLIKSIEGLDPVRANIVSSGFASQDGEVFQSSRREKRNPIIRLGFIPDYTDFSVSDLRNALYDYFLPKAYVTLRFYDTDGDTYELSGYVETFDAPLFVKEPEATISILSMDPDFVDPELVVREKTTSSSPVIDSFDYEGTVSSGVVFRLFPDREMTGFTIYNEVAGYPTQSLQFVGEILEDDLITLSTISGNKYARVIRDSVESSILYGISPYSDWITLYPGINNLRYTAEGASIPITVEYNLRYGGL